MTIKKINNEVKKYSNEKPNYNSILLNPIASDKALYNLENRNTLIFKVS